MKYNNLHNIKPEILQPVYFIGPVAKEVLGFWANPSIGFISSDETIKGYFAKHWRALDVAELQLFDYPKQYKPESLPKPKQIKVKSNRKVEKKNI